MARTQAADYEQRREAIVRQAAHLFATSGFAGTSVADLARAGDTSKSLIYHYYPSKEDILYAVMTSHVDILRQDVEEVHQQGGAAPDRLRAVVHRFMSHYVGAADRQKVLLNEMDGLPPERRREIVGKQRKIVAAVGLILSEVYPALAADPARVSATTMLLFGMINWTHTWYDPSGTLSAAQVADMALDMVLGKGVSAA